MAAWWFLIRKKTVAEAVVVAEGAAKNVVERIEQEMPVSAGHYKLRRTTSGKPICLGPDNTQVPLSKCGIGPVGGW
jgi:hypothetical protein